MATAVHASPSLTSAALEGVRTLFGVAATMSVTIALLTLTKSGDGRPVLVLPGFGAHDISTEPLRLFLRAKNYVPYGWGFGVNTGPNQETIEHCIKLVRALSEKHGCKISLGGHSLGGLFARELARNLPDHIDRVITLGSPFGMAANPNASLPIVKALFDYLNPNSALGADTALVRNLLVPPPGMPATSLYTKLDGVVHWTSCINPEGPQAENIGIKRAGHCGLIVDPTAWAVIADRLAEPLENWKPYKPSDHPLLWGVIDGEPDTRPATPLFSADEQARIARSRPKLGLAA